MPWAELPDLVFQVRIDWAILNVVAKVNVAFFILFMTDMVGIGV